LIRILSGRFGTLVTEEPDLHVGRSIGEAAIRTYQRYISRDYNGERSAACVYTPSCSEYTRQSVESLGLARGSLEGTMRLLRCNPDERRHHEEELFALLGSTSLQDLGTRLKCESPEALDALRELKGLCDEEAALLREAPVRQERVKQVRWRREDRMHALQLVHQDLPPGQISTEPDLVVRVRPARAAVETKHGLVARALAASAGAVGLVAGAAVGASLGMVTGLAVGVVAGGAAGTGALDRWDAAVAERWPESKGGVARAERPLGIARWLRSALGGSLAASFVAMPVGVVSGALTGTLLGTLGGARVGARMGLALGRNATLETLK